MDVATLSVAQVTSSMEQAQLAMAAQRLRMNANAALEAAQQSMARIANLAAGVGGHLDVSV
jgi:hypothetical protein